MRFARAAVLTCLVVVLLILQIGCSGAVAQSPSANSTNAALPAVAQLTSVTPTSVPAGHAAFQLVANGTNFSAQSVIVWNGSAQATTFVSSNELTSQIPSTAVAQSSAVTIAIKNMQSGEVSNALSVTVGNPPEITTTSLPAGRTGASYSAPISVSGGIAPFHWSMASGSLPSGLALNSQTGIISGTAIDSGDTDLGVEVTDSVNSTARANFAIEVAAAGQTSNPTGSSGSATGFYGSGIGSDGLANTTVGPQGNTVSYRFRAQHSGPLQQALIYLIPDHAGYAGGNAGTTQVTLNTDDGSSAHDPSSTVLASYILSGVLSLPSPARYFYTVKFASPPTLTAGQLYHLVFKSIDSSPSANFLSVDAMYELDFSDTIQGGISKTDAAVLLGRSGANWAPRPGYTPIYQLQFASGVTEGIGYIEGWIGAPRPISGITAVRETFTVSGAAVKVNSIRVRVARAVGNDPLSVRLENANGTLIEEGSIPATAIPLSSLSSPAYFWADLPLSATYTLEPGDIYHLDLEASLTSVYETFPIRKGFAYGFQTNTFFHDGYAEFGIAGVWSGWTQWGVANRTDGDLQFYFPVVP